METRMFEAVVAGATPLETSLVEWKPISADRLWTFVPSLETSLVEWKLRRPEEMDGHVHYLGNFLSGMETRPPDDAVADTFALETSLVEWKPIPLCYIV